MGGQYTRMMAGMTELYELPVHIGNIGTRTVCVGGDIV